MAMFCKIVSIPIKHSQTESVAVLGNLCCKLSIAFSIPSDVNITDLWCIFIL